MKHDAEIEARIVRAGADPTLSLAALAERFGKSKLTISRILCAAGVRREHELLQPRELRKFSGKSWMAQKRARGAA